MADFDSKEVCVYGDDGRYKFSLDTRQGLNPNSRSCPWNVAVNADGIWYVTDYSPYVKMYSPQGVYKNRWGASSPHGTKGANLYGLTMDVNGNFLVGDIYNRCISRHRQDGSQVDSIKVDIRPYHLGATPQDTIVISDLNKVQIVANTGHVLHTLNPDRQETIGPWGVCVCHDIIYVCNRFKPEILCFSLSAEYIGPIAIRDNPCCVTMVKDHSRLFVSTASDRVLVYKNIALTF